MKGKSARSVDLTDEQKQIIKSFNLLTMKPVIYVANVSEEDYAHPENCKYYQVVKKIAEDEHVECIAISAEIEAELANLETEEKKEYLADLGVNETGLDRLVRSTYSLLNLGTFFTVGEDEVRAWTFKKCMKAPNALVLFIQILKKGLLEQKLMLVKIFLNINQKKL